MLINLSHTVWRKLHTPLTYTRKVCDGQKSGARSGLRFWTGRNIFATPICDTSFNFRQDFDDDDDVEACLVEREPYLNRVLESAAIHKDLAGVRVGRDVRHREGHHL